MSLRLIFSKASRNVAGNTALEEDKVLANLAVVDKAAERGDGLLGEVELGGGVRGIVALADEEDLLVLLDTVVVTVLTGTRN